MSGSTVCLRTGNEVELVDASDPSRIHQIGGVSWASTPLEGGWYAVPGVALTVAGNLLYAAGGSKLAIANIRDILATPRFVQSEGSHAIHWELGTLQVSPTLNSPWTELPAARPFPL